MAQINTAEQAKAEYIEAMGETLGPQFYALWQEVAWLHIKWNEYVELFGKKPSRIELLNRAASHFFGIVQDLLWEETILHIARLTDPPKHGKHEHLTIKALPILVDDVGLKEIVQNLIALAIAKAEFCRQWRDRRIAHSELRLAIDEGVKPLPPASRRDVREAIGSIDDVLNAVTSHYLDSTTHFDVVQQANGAEALLYVLDDGLRADAERTARIHRKEYRKEDIAVRDL